MAAYASTALTGLGYAYSNAEDPYSSVKNMPLSKGDVPSMNNMYNSTHWNTVRTDEFNSATASWKKSQNPLNTGVVPRPARSDMFVPVKPLETNENKKNEVVSLTGENIAAENFTHNNMFAYFRGSDTTKQNTDPNASSTYLENSTGIGKYYKHKKEVECFFEPTTGIGNVCSMDNNSDFYRSHLQKPNSRNNDFPIQQVRVGPGLGEGYTSDPAGGFQQASTLNIIRPKTIDDLRPLSRPKTTVELPVQGPKMNQVPNRGIVSDIAKNRPDTYHEQSTNQWLQTTGAVTKSRETPEFIVRPTVRANGHVQYMGASKADSQPGRGELDDYGREGIIIYDNSRDETQKRTVISNFTSIVKSIAAPFLDILKHTTKEYLVDASRTYGNMSIQIPEKSTLYDPVNNIMKTTVKETTLHNTTINNLRGNDKGWVESDDVAKGTIKETTIDDPTINNPRGNDKGWVQRDDLAKGTIKETMIDDPTINNPRGNDKGWVERDDLAKGTIKETMIDDTTINNPRGIDKGWVERDDLAKGTIKETLIHDTIINNPRGTNKGRTTADDSARSTMRQTTKDVDTVRNINARTYKTVVINPEMIAKKTVKETTIVNKNATGNINANKQGGYSHIEVEVFETQKQFISNNPHTGISGGGNQYYPRTMDAEYSAEIDGTREMMNIRAGYTPNAEGISQGVGSSGIDLEIKKMESDAVNPRTEGNITRILKQGETEVSPCQITKTPQKQEYIENCNNRLDPNLLSSLKDNPFNLSINPI
jgi:hypothetical protein